MSYIWIKRLKNSITYGRKKLKIFLQIIMTKISSILKIRKKDIIFIIKLIIPKISIINISISSDLKIIIYIVLNLLYILLREKRKK